MVDFSAVDTYLASILFPPFGLVFLALVCLLLYYHEDDSVNTLPFVGIYLAFLVVADYGKGFWFLLSHYVWTLCFVVSYAAVGILWTIPKMAFYMQKPKAIDALKAQIASAKRGSSAPVKSQDIALAFVAVHKWKIYTWVAYWPFNIVTTVSRDPMRILFE